MTQDASALAGSVHNRGAESGRLHHPAANDQQGAARPFTRNGDEVSWTDIIAWLHYGLIEARNSA